MGPDAAEAARRVAVAVPADVLELMARLRAGGHAAWVVGGSVRDAILGRPAADWDLTTDARPERILELLPDAAYENRFGTVAVRRPDGVHEITTFRTDHEYADFRRPHRIEFGDSLEADLGRRDFTANAIAWGWPRPGAEPVEPAAADTRPGAVDGVLEDPFDGLADLRTRTLRAVGDPTSRFEEDALRMIRAVRLAATLEARIEPATLQAIAGHADLVRHLSQERIAAELAKLLAAPRPSVGLALLESTGLLRVISPELADQRGVPQDKIPGDDLWDHTLRTVDAVPVDRPVVRLAGLLHDIGKPATAGDGHFHAHESVGAGLAETLLDRLRFPRATAERVVQLVRLHMFDYQGSWSDAAVRRFIKRTGRDGVDELLDLRAADNVGSGLAADAGGLEELRARVADQLLAEVALDRGDLAVDGNDLMAELGLTPGPALGRIIDDLLERVLADPSLNDRPTLLLIAQSMLADEGA
ncbi:MAG TPA: HD domain-containing protein [Candidatus Limnocylindrales bacterium]|nr:HD domain-containing protein [Candidatus Limnocylindrales bacterium]